MTFETKLRVLTSLLSQVEARFLPGFQSAIEWMNVLEARSDRSCATRALDASCGQWKRQD